MKNLISSLLLFLAGTCMQAQEQTSRFHFYSINSAVLVNGENATTGALQSVNGFTKGNWFAGAGIGLDYYQYRSIPVFADLRYEFGKKQNRFFAYADAGISFEWVQDYFYDIPEIWNNSRSNSFHNGLYTDAGMGYAVRMKNQQAVILSLGFSQKNMTQKIRQRDWRTQDWITDEYYYKFKRILLKAGWRF